MKTKVNIEAGICGFETTVFASCDDGQNTEIRIKTQCPNIKKASEKIKRVDALKEILSKPAETTIYKILSEYLPHVSCPVYSGIFKAIEVSSGLALAKDCSIKIDTFDENGL